MSGTVHNTLADALRLHQSGRLEEAEKGYRQVLSMQPNHPDGLNLLGVLCMQTNRLEEAQNLLERNVRLHPSQALFHLHLGNAREAAGKVSEAIECWRTAVKLAPDFVDAHLQLAAALTRQGDTTAAEQQWHQVLRLAPNLPEAHFQLGQMLGAQRRFTEAVQHLQHSVQLNPTNFTAYNSLGVALSELRHHAAAADAFARAVALSPRNAPFHMNLGHALRAMERDPEAEAAFRTAIELSRTVLGGSYHGLAAALRDQGKLDEAAVHATEAIHVMPGFAPGYHNLGNIHYDAGLITPAIANYRRALELDPTLAEAHGSLLLLLHYQRGDDAQMLFDEHLCWARRHAEPIMANARPVANNRDPQRRLRVGYLSPDFRAHPVGFAIEPILAAHDREVIEVVGYYNRLQSDEWTARIRKQCALWRDVKKMSDEQLDQVIRDDQIDILVDLAGHTAGNRLLVFARRPAPVQVTYLGYPDTTGMSAMQYKLTDAWQDPSDNDRFYTENLLRLPGGAWCFRPREEMPAVGALPADSNGFVTFICGNKIAKVTDEMLDLWRQLLERLPEAKLIVRSGGDQAGEQRVRDVFHDVDPARLELAGRGSFEDYFALYNRSDIGLDSYPYNGYMTTCDSLWMGVPVITLAGQTHVTRTGVSLLSKVGLEEFICASPRDYIDRAMAVANDLDALRTLRARLRQRVAERGLSDGTRLAREIETAYREMWRHWCQRSD